MMCMDVQKLQNLGLTHNEALTYIALLELGETKTGAIVKKTGLHRVLIYDALESLIKKGLASYVIKENIKYFQASDPNNLVSFLQEKEELAKSILPELDVLRTLSQSKQTVSIYEGVKGLKSAMNNMLKEIPVKGDHRVFASGNMAPTVGEYYFHFQNEKKRKKILTKAIVDISFNIPENVMKATYAVIRRYPLGPFPTDTWIYNDKVLIVIYTTKPPIAILITSKETSDSYKTLFNGFWKQAKEQ